MMLPLNVNKDTSSYHVAMNYSLSLRFLSVLFFSTLFLYPFSSIFDLLLSLCPSLFSFIFFLPHFFPYLSYINTCE